MMGKVGVLPNDSNDSTNPDEEELSVHSKHAASQDGVSDVISSSRSAKGKSYR